jgi:CDP-glycerol glycerophosphotransferase (TagB/SpsB family)
VKLQKILKKSAESVRDYPRFLRTLLVRRNPKLWVFGAWFGNRYSDNSKYVFDYVCEHEPTIRAVWLSHNPDIVAQVRSIGREAYLADSPEGFQIGVRAGVTFINVDSPDVNRVAASGSIIVQLWHGTPLKKIQYDDRLNDNVSPIIPALKSLYVRAFPFARKDWDLIISPSPEVSQRLRTAFRAKQDSIVVTGYPRGDVILGQVRDVAELRERLHIQATFDRVVLYLPTHRGAGGPKYQFNIFEGLDVNALEEALARQNAVLLIKRHYYEQNAPNLRDDATSRIRLLTEPEAPDINVLLPDADVLVTDYSSVYFDFLLLDRPIVFTPFDIDQYISKERSLYDDYNSVTPGPKCQNWNEAIAAIEVALSGSDGYADARKAATLKFNAFVDTENSKRVVAAAKKRLALE